MFALYQSGGALLGVGETAAAALDDALLEEAILVNALGAAVDLDQYWDYTRVTIPGLEVSGELYLRRCTLALFEAAYDAVPSALRYYTRTDGYLDLGNGENECHPYKRRKNL